MGGVSNLSNFREQKPKVMLFLDLIQDLDLILPLLKALQKREDLTYQVCVTNWLVEESPRVSNTLKSLNVDYSVLYRKSIRLGLQPRLTGIHALITAAESTAGPHRCAHAITKRANKAGVHTYTLQHGFENVGLNYFDEVETPELIKFASQKILLWGNTNLLSPETATETVERCLPLGCPKEIITDNTDITIPGKRDYLIAIFENLHWRRYDDDYRQRFLADLEATALCFPDTTFLVKPHHAGQWLTKRYQGKLPRAENLVIADPKLPQWEAYTATALIKYADGVITTPSTVALDTARTQCPVSVISYGLNLSNYAPLTTINSLEDWKLFVEQLHQEEGKLAAKKQVQEFLDLNLIPGDAVGRILDLVSADLGQEMPILPSSELAYPTKDCLSYFHNIPFEYKFRNRKTGSQVTRLHTERSLYIGDVLTAQEKAKFISLIIPVAQIPNSELITTLNLWQLQSCPLINCLLVPQGENTRESLTLWLEQHNFADNISVWNEDSQEWEKLQQDSDFILFTCPGDILLPNLAHTLKLIALKNQTDVVVWQIEQLGAKTEDSCVIEDLLRRPQFQLHSISHSNYIGTGFAVKPNLAAQYPYQLWEQILDNDVHLFQIWLALKPELQWYTHPEYCTLRTLENKPAPLPQLVNPFWEKYQEVFSSQSDKFSLVKHNHPQQPYLLKPKRQAKSISVIIPFRDKPEYTCRCLESLAKQQLNSSLEIILINNQSKRSSVEYIKEFATQQQLESKVKIIDYDYPYNHSRQSNLGVEVSTGEVVVCLNNDAELVSNSILEEMAAWALIPGVGTVGCKISAPNGRLVCAGVKARMYASSKSLAVVQESEDPTYADVVRETFGNTFACAAISRDLYLEMGGLNAKEFPSEYNDADFILRLNKLGYTHIYLGHLLVYHVPGATRVGCDEMSQKLLLRQKFPEAFIGGLFQLESEMEILRKLGKILVNDRWQKNNKQKVDEQLKKTFLFRSLSRYPKVKQAAKSAYQKLRQLIP